MAATYLTAKYKDKDRVKELGARYDGQQQKWYVPEGRDLAPFAAWLPPEAVLPPGPSVAIAKPSPTTSPTSKGIRLSELLAEIAEVVSHKFPKPVWTTVEVVDAKRSAGHVFLELAERDGSGSMLARADGVIWASSAERLLPEFERATGATIDKGIKLLVFARPVFKAQHGFRLHIEAIDPDYTLGDLEARKREIRARLQKEGIFDANRKLPVPWDYRAVLVVAPQGAAGLGDFQAEATRLEQLSICRFVFAFSRFQGEGAPGEILAAVTRALEAWPADLVVLDAIVIIRGGGAVNDLAWLNDYELTRFVCTIDVPVLTGIGHERDSTLLDEVANRSFHTPSKVIAGIEAVIRERTTAAQQAYEEVLSVANRGVRHQSGLLYQADVAVRAAAQGHLAAARERSAELVAEIRESALRMLMEARQDIPALMGEVRSGARHRIDSAAMANATGHATVLERSRREVERARESTEREIHGVAVGARRVAAEALQRSKALVLEITGQGPEKTLGRGFAVVRDRDGKTLSRAAQIASNQDIDIQFHDGRVNARTKEEGKP
jgi:exodeoxyribonuclease VII large subunit